MQLRRVPQLQALRQLVPDKPFRPTRCRPSSPAPRLSSPATATNTRPERPSGANCTSLTVARPMRGSRQLAFQDGANLVAQRFRQALHVIFTPAALRHGLTPRKNSRE